MYSIYSTRCTCRARTEARSKESLRKPHALYEANTRCTSQNALAFCVFNEMHAHRYCTSDTGGRSNVRNSSRKTCKQHEATPQRKSQDVFEMLLSCLRRTRFERKSTQKRSKIDENPTQIAPKSTPNQFLVVLGPHGRFGAVSGRAQDGL